MRPRAPEPPEIFAILLVTVLGWTFSCSSPRATLAIRPAVRPPILGATKCEQQAVDQATPRMMIADPTTTATRIGATAEGLEAMRPVIGSQRPGASSGRWVVRRATVLSASAHLCASVRLVDAGGAAAVSSCTGQAFPSPAVLTLELAAASLLSLLATHWSPTRRTGGARRVVVPSAPQATRGRLPSDGTTGSTPPLYSFAAFSPSLRGAPRLVRATARQAATPQPRVPRERRLAQSRRHSPHTRRAAHRSPTTTRS